MSVTKVNFQANNSEKKQENPLPSYNRFKHNSLWLFSVKNFKLSAYVYTICLLQLAFRKTSTILFRLYYKEVTISESQKLLLCSRNIVKRQQKSKFLQGSAGRGRRRSTRARELGAKSVGTVVAIKKINNKNTG